MASVSISMIRRINHFLKRSFARALLVILAVPSVAALVASCGNSAPSDCANWDEIAERSANEDIAGAAILLNTECAEMLAASRDMNKLAILEEAALPSLFYEQEPDEVFLSEMEIRMHQGDHGFFAFDTDFEGVLTELAREHPTLAERALHLRDFVLAARERPIREGDPSSIPNDMVAYATFLPVWQHQAARQAVLRICDEGGCTVETPSVDVCDIEQIKLTKLAYARDPEETRDRIDGCDAASLTTEFLHALRRHGLIDATCTTTLQVNAIRQRGFAHGESCTALLETLAEQNALTGADVVSYVRRLRASELAIDADAIEANIARIGIVSPTVAEQLRKSTP